MAGWPSVRHEVAGCPPPPPTHTHTSDHEVPGSNPAGGGIHDCMMLHCIELFIITFPSSQNDLTDVERDVKHQVIIIIGDMI